MRVIALIVTAQPFILNSFLARTNHETKHQSLFSFTRSASLALWLGYVVSLAAGEVWSFNTASFEFLQTQQVDGDI